MATTLRLAALALAAALAFLVVCQLTVATWLARDNAERAALRARGQTHWQWDFSRPESIVRSGSSGLAQARFAQDGLHASAPADGAIDLSLALRGERLDVAAIGRIALALQTSATARVLLMPQRGGARPAWVETWVEAGAHTLELAPLPIGAAPAEGLQLRIDTAAGAGVTLRRLALHPAAQGPLETIEAADASTPERLLAFRDRVLAQSPSMLVQAPAPWRSPALALARWLPAAAALPLLCLVLALAAAATAQYRRMRGADAPSPRRAVLELCAALLPCVALLLAGWPAREPNLAATLAFALAGAALLLAPAPQPAWRWFGDAAAWREAMFATVLTAVLLAPLLWLPDAGSAAPSRSPERFWRYPFWALLQQALLLFAIAPRCLVIARGRTGSAALLAGLAFALLHLPNFALMLATAAGGALWARLGYRHRALLPLAASHAALGLWLTQIAPVWLLRSAEVGGRFLMAE